MRLRWTGWASVRAVFWVCDFRGFCGFGCLICFCFCCINRLCIGSVGCRYLRVFGFSGFCGICWEFGIFAGILGYFRCNLACLGCFYCFFGILVVFGVGIILWI